MNLFEILRDLAEERRLPFLVIGGHAVNAFGYSRTTFDLDLLVRNSDADAWKAALLQLGYAVLNEAGAFVQLTPPMTALWPVDLMLVSEATFAGMSAQSSESLFRGIRLKTPSLEHLVALKLHALKQALPHRDAKDFGDLTQLIHANRIDVRDEGFRRLVEKYGTPQIYERLIQFRSGASAEA